MDLVKQLQERHSYALVTGASSGIGECFARRLAALGLNIVLVARSADKLADVAADIEKQHKVSVEAVPLDLSQRGCGERLAEECGKRGVTVDMLVNNAGLGDHGRFVGSPLERQTMQIDLNISALVETTHAFLTSMRDRKFGVIVNISSTASLQPVPYMAVYGASKAFVTSFSEALSVELAGTGVHALALLPGNTETPFHGKVGETNGRVGSARTSDQVVDTCLDALRHGRSFAIDGFANAATAVAPRLLPRSLVNKVTGDLMSKGL